MERTLLVVEPEDRGWRVRLGRISLTCRSTREAALDFAAAQAEQRHANTGQPTGVKVAMADGEGVLVLARG